MDRIDFTRCQENENASYFSTIDHFFWNEDLSSSIVDAGVLHSPDNCSDHSPIYCVLKRENIQTDQERSFCSSEKPSWRKASEEKKSNFKLLLNEKLLEIDIPFSVNNCANVHCKEPSHCEDADKLIGHLLEAVEDSAKDALPIKKTGPAIRKNVTPGWKKEVKPFRDKAFFWSQVWTFAGKPIGTVLHTLMKRSRNIYHYLGDTS